MREQQPAPPGGRPTTPLGPDAPWGQPPRPGGPDGAPRRRAVWPRVLLAVLLLGVVLFAGAALLVRFSPWPSLPNPFASREVDRSPPVVLKAVEDLHVYKAAAGNYQVIIDLEKDARYLPSFIKGERTVFVAAGSVDAEVDFSRIGKGAIKVSDDRRTVSITLPHARLTKARIDLDRSYVASRQRGLLDRLGGALSDNPTSDRELYRLASDKLGAAAGESGLVARAEANTRAMLAGMMHSLGFTSVTVTFQDPPT